MAQDAALTPLDDLVASPFARLAALLAGIEPGAPPLDLSLGEPHAFIPAFLGPILHEHVREFGRYPPIRGILPLRQAFADWIGRRYPTLAGKIDPEAHVLPLNGSREGLFSAIFPARARKEGVARPAVLIPNPFYQAYAAAAAAAGAEPIFLPSPAARGFLPDLAGLDEALLRRTIALYLCSPSNPQGAVADQALLARAIGLARAYDFLLFADECYSEIYDAAPPPGALETAFAQGGGFANVVAFQSLSKRSGLPGLRSGFVAGDSAFIGAFGRFRNVACPQMPLAPPACLDRRLVGRGACGGGKGALPPEFRHRRRPAPRPVRLPAPGRAPSFCGSISALPGAARRRRKPFGKFVVSKCCRAHISRAPARTAEIRARTM